MAANECAKIAGLRQVHHLFLDGGTCVYWGRYLESQGMEFQVLAREDKIGVITFFVKPWNLQVNPTPTPRQHLKSEEDSLSDRMGALNKKLDSAIFVLRERVNSAETNIGFGRARIERLEVKVDEAIVKAQTRRDLLSQRLDTAMSKVLAVEKELHKEDHYNINRLDKVVVDVRVLEKNIPPACEAALVAVKGVQKYLTSLQKHVIVLQGTVFDLKFPNYPD